MRNARIHAGIYAILLAMIFAVHARGDTDPRLNDDYLRAVGSGDIDKVRALLQQGADINAKGINGSYALQDSIGQARTDIVKLLLEKGADVNISDEFGMTPLIEAIRNDRTEVVKLLLDRHADVHANKDRAIRDAARADIEIFKMLIDAGGDLKSKDEHGVTVQMLAAYSPEKLKLLVSKGQELDLKSIDENGDTVLTYAVMSGEPQSLQLVLEKGADPKAVDREGRTLIMCLPLNTLGEPAHDDEMIKLLVQKGVDVNAKDHAGRTALHVAAHQYLTESGGNMAHSSVIAALLDAGADVNAKDANGNTALDLIRQGNPKNPEVEQLLIKRGGKGK